MIIACLAIGVLFGIGTVFLAAYGLYLWSKKDAKNFDKLRHD